MKMYYVKYKMEQHWTPTGIALLAKNKEDAYDKAVYEQIPKREGEAPYSAWVSSVTYNVEKRTY